MRNRTAVLTMLITAAPLVVVPAIVMWSILDDPMDGYAGLLVGPAILGIALLMAVYLAAGLLAAVLAFKSVGARPVGFGVICGLCLGLVLGVASCTGSLIALG